MDGVTLFCDGLLLASRRASVTIVLGPVAEMGGSRLSPGSRFLKVSVIDYRKSYVDGKNAREDAKL